LEDENEDHHDDAGETILLTPRHLSISVVVLVVLLIIA
jgi:hypothetical protein